MPTDPITYLAALGQRLVQNLQSTWEELSPQKMIRLVIIAGAYLLFRPYLMKWTGYQQMQQHEKEAEESEQRAAAALSANDIRGGPRAAAKVQIPSAESDDVADAGSSGADWGTNARKRQREMLKKMLSVEEKRLADAQGDEDDKDIAEFLEE